MTDTATRPTARSTFELRVGGTDEAGSIFLNDAGNRALKYLHLHGACRDLGPEVFFPEKGKPAREAYVVCASCSVRADCLAFSLRTAEREGVWGGTNEVLRRPLMRRVAAGEAPEAVAAEYCAHVAPPVRPRHYRHYTDELKAEVLRICTEAGPLAASEKTGVLYTTVRSWADSQRQAARRAALRAVENEGTGETGTMTDDKVSEMVERAVTVALAAQVEALNRALAETLAEFVERLDMLTAATAEAFHVLAPLDPALAEAAAVLDQATSHETESAAS